MKTWTTESIVKFFLRDIANYEWKVEAYNKPGMLANAKTLRFALIRLIDRDDYMSPAERNKLIEQVNEGGKTNE